MLLDRNGNWDIYGYNLIEKEEFQITTDSSDQRNPAVYGDIVVWTDDRNNNEDIYGCKVNLPRDLPPVTYPPTSLSPASPPTPPLIPLLRDLIYAILVVGLIVTIVVAKMTIMKERPAEKIKEKPERIFQKMISIDI